MFDLYNNDDPNDPEFAELRETIFDKLKQQCDQDGEDCIEVGYWDGGHDSGTVYITIDGLTEEEQGYIEACVDEALDHGSWSGAFSSAGNLLYLRATETIEGSGKCEYQDEYEVASSEEYTIPVTQEIAEAIVEIVGRNGMFLADNGVVFPEGKSAADRLRPGFYTLRFRDGEMPEGACELEETIAAHIEAWMEREHFSTTEISDAPCGDVILTLLEADGQHRVELELNVLQYPAEDEYFTIPRLNDNEELEDLEANEVQ